MFASETYATEGKYARMRTERTDQIVTDLGTLVAPALSHFGIRMLQYGEVLRYDFANHVDWRVSGSGYQVVVSGFRGASLEYAGIRGGGKSPLDRFIKVDALPGDAEYRIAQGLVNLATQLHRMTGWPVVACSVASCREGAWHLIRPMKEMSQIQLIHDTLRGSIGVADWHVAIDLPSKRRWQWLH
jgi:roadblock/LC7 domain-containing protein